MRDVDVFVGVEHNATRKWRDRKRRYKLAIVRKRLHAGVVKVRDEDFIRAIDGYADREVQLPLLRSQLAELEDKPWWLRRAFFASGNSRRRHHRAEKKLHCDEVGKQASHPRIQKRGGVGHSPAAAPLFADAPPKSFGSFTPKVFTKNA